MPAKRDEFRCKWPGCTHPPFEGKYQRQYLFKHQKACPFNPSNTTPIVEAPQQNPPSAPTLPPINITINPTFTTNNTVSPSQVTNQVATANNEAPPTPELRSFGCESIDHLIGELSPTQLVEMMKYPEDAITSDMANMLWFNLDTPQNSTVRMDNAGNPQVYKASKWRPVQPIDLLRMMSNHFMALADQCKKHPTGLWACVGRVQEALIHEIHRIIHVEDAKDVRVSQYAPYHGRTNEDVISPKKLAEDLMRTVRENCTLPREDWVRTNDFALQIYGT